MQQGRKSTSIGPAVRFYHWVKHGWAGFRFNAWVSFTWMLAFVVAFPLLSILTAFLGEADTAWGHITKNLLPTYVSNTLCLLLGTGALTLTIGTLSAWLVSVYDFPGRRLLEGALTLPIAIPGYILGFTWAGMLDYTSPLYTFLRNTWGVNTGAYLFFDLLSLPGAILILSLALYPYVYLAARAWFGRQSAGLFEAAAALGHSKTRVFRTLTLPLARPALVGGLALVLMEVLNDYGVVSYFGVDTFTTGIFSAWFAFGSKTSAVKLSAWLLLLVFALLLGERLQRGQKRYDTLRGSSRPLLRTPLHGLSRLGAQTLTALPVLMGFVLPVLMLLYWSWLTGTETLAHRFLPLLTNSFLLATVATLLVVTAALLTAFTARSFPSPKTRFLVRFSTMGYAIPGAVVAIGVLVPFLWLDHQLNTWGGTGGLWLTGTWFALIFAYLVRFLAVAYNNIESSLTRTSTSLDEAAQSLGHPRSHILRNILLPLIQPGILAAALLVFIDVLKELPLTLILRPFNFDTLAIRAFEYASDERVAEAAPASLVIIGLGLVAAAVLNNITKTRKNEPTSD